ncbi:MAG: FG-GAP repeat domain-containing protein, partial [Flavitalea sp.]
KGMLTKVQGAIPVFAQASCILPGDINKDGFIDLVLFGRVTPMSYGKPSSSYILINNGKGMFADKTAEFAPFLKEAGMITDADWVDIDQDGDEDIVACFEWGTIDVFINDGRKFTQKQIAPEKGWWNFLLPVDIDQDGDMDFIAGNAGLNTRFTPSVKEPLRLYTTDFDENGRTEQVMTYYLGGKEIPFSNKDELQKQFPVIKKKFLYAEDFAKAKFSDMFESEKLGTAGVRTADYFANVILINEGNLKFKTVALPWLAQLSAYKDAVVIDANGDQLPDIFLGGNFYDNNIQMGRYDADYGTILVNKGKGNLEASSINGLSIKGQVRKIKPVTIKGNSAWVLAKNSDSLRVINFKTSGKLESTVGTKSPND